MRQTGIQGQRARKKSELHPASCCRPMIQTGYDDINFQAGIKKPPSVGGFVFVLYFLLKIIKESYSFLSCSEPEQTEGQNPNNRPSNCNYFNAAHGLLLIRICMIIQLSIKNNQTLTQVKHPPDNECNHGSQ